MIKAVMIDFGGVLVRTEDAVLRRQWEHRLRLAEGDLDKIIFDSEVSIKATLGLASESAIWDHVAAVLHLNQTDLQALKVDFWKNDRLDQDLVQFLLSLRGKYTTCILSNAWPDARKLFTEVYHLGDKVDKIIISGEIGLAKPVSRIYEYAAEQLKVKCEEIIFIDDSNVNVLGAVQTGIKAIQFKGTKELFEALAPLIEM